MPHFTPQDYDIPEHFKHWNGDPAEDHIGPFFYYRDENGTINTALRVQAHHCNVYKITHGGILMAFADYTLGITAMESENDQIVTISCNNEFVNHASEGDLIVGHGELVRPTRSLVFTRATLTVGERTLLTSSGIFKRIRPSKG
ncbi:MAG: PaaI family thioesterase [Chloroflexota bacterium]